MGGKAPTTKSRRQALAKAEKSAANIAESESEALQPENKRKTSKVETRKLAEEVLAVKGTVEKVRKPLQELNLLDRFLFAEAADHTEFMEILLSILLERDIKLQKLPQTEKEIRSEQTQRQIRLDVWAMDQEDAIYNTEAQGRNTHNLLKRSRYYQGLLDSSLLEPGDKQFNHLKDVYILIIAPFDLFGYGLYRYTFHM